MDPLHLKTYIEHEGQVPALNSMDGRKEMHCKDSRGKSKTERKHFTLLQDDPGLVIEPICGMNVNRFPGHAENIPSISSVY